jgi:hypothetical protein
MDLMLGNRKSGQLSAEDYTLSDISSARGAPRRVISQ